MSRCWLTVIKRTICDVLLTSSNLLPVRSLIEIISQYAVALPTVTTLITGRRHDMEWTPTPDPGQMYGPAGMTIWCDPHASKAVGARPALIICDHQFHNLRRFEIGSGADSSDRALSLFAGENQLARSIERAPDGLAIGEAGFGMIGSALGSTQYEPDQRPCLYVADPVFHAIRRITLPAHWNVLPDL